MASIEKAIAKERGITAGEFIPVSWVEWWIEDHVLSRTTGQLVLVNEMLDDWKDKEKRNSKSDEEEMLIELINHIDIVCHGKCMHFLQDDGMWYSRYSGQHQTMEQMLKSIHHDLSELDQWATDKEAK